MKIAALQSGSNGNSVYVEADGVRLLFDAGISGKRAEQRLAGFGRDIRNVDALLISHDHSDHVRCAGVYHRKFDIPVFITAATLETAESKYSLGRLDGVCHFTAGDVLQFGDVKVETIPTPHDGADGVAFVVDDGSSRLGILTDLGHVFEELGELIGSLDAVLIESNYDADMLAGGPYPAFLKRRITGSGGHISNTESAQLLLNSAGERMKWACLAHLSQDNNSPQLAAETHRNILQGKMPIHLTSRHHATEMMEV